MRRDSRRTGARRAPALNRLVSIGLAAVIAVLFVGCGSRSSTVGEPSADPSTTPESSVSASSSSPNDLLRDFLAARVAGEGAQQYLDIPEEDIPLLYATT